MNLKILFELKKFLKNLDKSLVEHINLHIELLEENGQDLRMPYSKALGRGLFELRIVSKVNIRIFCCFHENTVYLLDIVIKKNQRLSAKDITYAREIKKRLERL